MIVVAVLSLAGCSTQSLSQTTIESRRELQQPPPSPAQPATQSHANPGNPETRALLSQESTPDDRRAAVSQLLESQRFDDLKAALDAGDPAVDAAIFQTIVDLGAPPPEQLIPAIIDKVESAGIDADPMAVRCLATIPTKPAITVVVNILSLDAAPKRLLREAVATLREQTGRDDLGDDTAAWVGWWEEARWLPPREWEAMQAVAQAERARRLNRELQQQHDRIIELHRKTYALTPQEQRSALLATMMADSDSGVRALAFELAERALLNTQRLDDSVKAAAVVRLEDPIPTLRASAASLLFRLGSGAEATEAIRRAIRRESDPVAAAAMLEYLRRRPIESDLVVCIDWLSGLEPASSAAASTLASGVTSGSLIQPRIWNHALANLRAIASDDLTPGKVELWGLLGEFSDRQNIAALLTPETAPAVRRAAAGVLVRWPEAVDWLAEATRRIPTLFPLLADAIGLHETSNAGYQILASIPAIDPELRDARLLRLRKAMPPKELLLTIGPAESRVAVIESVLFDPDQRNVIRRDPGLHLTRALIEARYAAGDDTEVIEAFGLLDPESIGRLPESIKSLQRRALICLGRFDEASQSGASELDWKAASSRSERLGLELSPQIIAEARTRFPEADLETAPPEASSDDAPEPEQTERDANDVGVPGSEGMMHEILTRDPEGDTRGPSHP
ncbi:MAG: hypothetical protein H6813_07545 [Phycisphaeraceae bacterium]|nr:hypothetical protein [Phycisphaeraceae bacterium]MCB9848349.1 hypothetical protein [Phycisphaeraceae bacterium]